MFKTALNEMKMKIEMNEMEILRFVRLAATLAKKKKKTKLITVYHFFIIAKLKFEQKSSSLKNVFFFNCTVLTLGIVFHIIL